MEMKIRVFNTRTGNYEDMFTEVIDGKVYLPPYILVTLHSVNDLLIAAKKEAALNEALAYTE